MMNLQSNLETLAKAQAHMDELSPRDVVAFQRRIRYVPVRTLEHAQLIHDRYRAASTAAVRVPAKASNRIRLRRFRLLDYTRRRWLDVPDRLAARILVP